MPIIDNFNMNKLNENILFDEQDIYYNKDKFDSSEINLCFIIGHSGSGKTTMGNSILNNNKFVDVYRLDDIVDNYNFSDNNLKEYGDLAYSFFKTKGKKYRMHSLDELNKWYSENGNYSEFLIKDFINYSINYSKDHKNKKFILEGIWIYMYIKPEILDDYAVYIKGTSMLKSKIRAAKRDSSNFTSMITDIVNKYWKYYILDEKSINNYRDHFKKLLNK